MVMGGLGTRLRARVTMSGEITRLDKMGGGNAAMGIVVDVKGLERFVVN